MATAGTLEKHCSQKTICSGVRLKCGGNFKKGYLITLIYFMAENECQWTAEFSIFPVWHTEWAFQRQTWEENVCSCTAQQWSQGALFHQNTGCSDCGWTMKKKKMTQMADKDRPCTPLRSLLSTPVSVFNFQSSTRMEEVAKGYSWEGEKRWEGKGRGGRGE